jgi:16S rRNA (guanine527-N7)-methyltransferase
VSGKRLEEKRIRTALFRLASELGVPISSQRTELLVRFLAELSLWKTATNLVGDLSEEDLAFHCVESAFGAGLLESEEHVLDIGSGAGFPGIPLAIWGVRVTLLEPRERRAAFLRHLLRAMPGAGLNAEVRADRVERLSGSTFDSATVRAVGGLGARMGEANFLKSKGKLLIWTSDAPRYARELEPNFRFEASHPIPTTRRREIAVFRKCSTGNI